MGQKSRISARKLTALLFIIIAALLALMILSLYRQLSQSTEVRSVEAGLIEAEGSPTIYFNLKNIGANTANYTYKVICNLTAEPTLDEGIILNVPPGGIFYYTIALTSPEQGTLEVTLEVYKDEETVSQNLLFRQKWIIKG